MHYPKDSEEPLHSGRVTDDLQKFTWPARKRGRVGRRERLGTWNRERDHRGQLCHPGDVTGDSFIDGLIGDNLGAVTASYSIGRVNGSGSFVGGLVGRIDTNVANVTASYYNSSSSGQSDTGKGVGKTTDELITPTGYTGIYANWNLDLDGDTTADNPWRFGARWKYPGLIDGAGILRRPPTRRRSC